MLQEIITSLKGNIIQLDPIEFWAGFIFFSVISVLSFYRMYRWYHHARLIENTPTAKIRSAAQGYVELNGDARLMKGPVIISPLSGRSCVWFRYKIEEKVQEHDSKGRSVSHWRIVKQQTSQELFLLEDDTGRCVIDPDDADVLTTDKRIWHKLSKRYTEELITENEPLYAIGLFKTVANVERQKLREHVSYLLRHWKSDPNQLLHDFDADRDGKLNAEEWEKVRLAAERHIKFEQGQQEKKEPLNILKLTENKDQAFILSTISEGNLIKRYKWQAIKSLILFFITGGLAVWAVNVRTLM
ncbi:MAG: hypothetical protein COB23_07895 [Methylophaga sp.]|nr:MAG: hypothetical protein COB23_07895 [Methylophaga sp.]